MQKSFYKKDTVKIVHLLDELNKDKYTKNILRDLANDNVLMGSESFGRKVGYRYF